MLLFIVIINGLVSSAGGKRAPDFGPEEDFLSELSAYRNDVTDKDVLLDFSALINPGVLNELDRELQLHPGILNGTQNFPGICQVCKKVLGWAISRIPQRDTARHIRSVLNGVCVAIPIPRFLCQYLLNNYLGKLVQQLLHHRNVGKICVGLGLCWWPQNKKLFLEKTPALNAGNRPPLRHRPH
ncbi:hypothetical protein JZ751_020409 [Albula glossodonta]|uniref:Saposin B-type domain-containing protein n=1 Tax=Albula glossodonta TaxID=121402 RepID=A0A8T2MRP7_9TELE|nr:hypothetical protein JZ751_020409 [Albula glossodonta]